MRVLLIEDDLQIGQSLLRALKDADYSVDWVRDGKAGCAAIEAAEYTVVLLDLGLPGMSGIELLKTCRSKGNPVPVQILTARDDLDARVFDTDGNTPLGTNFYGQLYAGPTSANLLPVGAPVRFRGAAPHRAQAVGADGGDQADRRQLHTDADEPGQGGGAL